MIDGSALDGAAIRAAHRVQQGNPAVFEPHTLYGHQVQDDELVCVALRPRVYKPVSFRGLSVA